VTNHEAPGVNRRGWRIPVRQTLPVPNQGPGCSLHKSDDALRAGTEIRCWRRTPKPQPPDVKAGLRFGVHRLGKFGAGDERRSHSRLT
jgi:hypothetical protein